MIHDDGVNRHRHLVGACSLRVAYIQREYKRCRYSNIGGKKRRIGVAASLNLNAWA